MSKVPEAYAANYSARFVAAYQARIAFAKAIADYHAGVREDWNRFGRPSGRAQSPSVGRLFDLRWQWLKEDVRDIARAMEAI